MKFTVGIKRGMSDTENIKQSKEPITVSLTASKPFPSKRSLCPGKTLRT